MSTQNIQFSRAQKIIRLEEIPAVDGPIRAALTEIHRTAPAPQSLTSLHERAKDLSDAKKLLQDAQNHKGRDKLFSLLSTTLFAGLAVATAFGFMINPLIGMGLVVLTLLYLLYCHTKASSIDHKDKRESQIWLSMYPLGVLVSPLILSHSLWTRVSFQEATVATCQQDVQSHGDESIRYWSSQGEQAAQRVRQEQQRAKKSLSAMEKLPIRSPNGEKDMREYSDLLARTQIEIERGKKLSSKKPS